jgi:8-oxo-dGTP pyrophosphatase MutT (NUDIX family)
MPELVDLVNQHGEIQKVGVPRHEVGNHSDLHMQIVIVIAFDSLLRMLVHRRGTEKSDAEKFDHICGAIQSGETPEAAAMREGLEETGVVLKNVRKVHEGVNEYSRYRHLLVADTEGEPSISDPKEVMWVGYMHPDKLRVIHAAGEIGFVDGFFEDVELVARSNGA